MQRIVLVGVGGIWLSALAQILYKLGYNSLIWIDSTPSQVTQYLQRMWLNIIIWHWKVKINDSDFIIYSDAATTSPEVQAAKTKFSFFQFVGEISKYFQTIAIAWTHWKSTTTAWSLFCLQNSNQTWLGIVGALVPQLNWQNFYLNETLKSTIKPIFDHIIIWKFKNFPYSHLKKYFFIVEADEYARHLLLLDPDISIITNIDYDHSDIFPTQQDYIDTFKLFAHKTKKAIITFPQVAQKLNLNSEKLILAWNKHFNLRLPWKHNQQNANLVYSLLQYLGKKHQCIEQFSWLWRRLEKLSDKPLIYTDYAHHPEELKAVYQALREKYPYHSLRVIFQPHQAQRVIQFFDEFSKVLSKFDKKIIYKIYAAREDIHKLAPVFENKTWEKISNFDQIGEKLAQKIGGSYITDFNYIQNIIWNVWTNELILIATAGDLDWKIRKWLEII